MSELYPDLEKAPIGGMVIYHIPYSGSYLLTQTALGEWEDEYKARYSTEEIQENIEATWEAYGDNWDGITKDWHAEAIRLQEVVNQAAELLRLTTEEARDEAQKLLDSKKTPLD